MNALASYAATAEVDYDTQVSKYAPLVKRIAYHLTGRLPPSVQIDDLIQAGMIGLLEALKNYDASQGASFETFARIRIQGAMIDEVRRGDWTPRSVYRKSRMLSQAVRDVENREGREARDREVAAELGVGLDEYNQMLKDTTGCHVLSYDEMVEDEQQVDVVDLRDESSPYRHVQQDMFKRKLAEVIASLPEREQLVMSLYYDEELNLREIGEILGVSEARVCQIHGQALVRLRARMQDWSDKE